MSGFNEYETVARDEDDAEPDTETRLGTWVDPSLDLCPVVPLGRKGERIYWAMPEGDIRHALASKIGPMLKTDIFASVEGAVFLTYWRDADNKFQQQSCAIWFVRACRKAGFWDESRTVRGLGVWAGPDGSVILHKGDEIWRYGADGIDKKSVLQAIREGGRGPIYELRPTAPAPGEPASASDGAWIRESLDLWRFKPIGDEGLTGADVAAGWIMPALLGAVAPFRGNVMYDAAPGGGKTTLMLFLQGLLSALAGDVLDDFTEAGLRNELAGMARPQLIDEAEGSPMSQGPGPVERALDVVRRMTTGSGGHRKMGTIGGGAVSQTAVGCVSMAAINPPRLSPADATRWVEVRLLPLNTPSAAPAPPRVATDADLKALMAKAREMAPALLGRALSQAGRYLADVATVKAAMVRQQASPRAADLIAMLSAGRRLLLFDTPLTDDEAKDELEFWKPLMAQREAAGAVSNTGAEAFAHLMSFRSDQHRHDRHLTIGELIAGVIKEDREYIDVLKNHGLRMEQVKGDWILYVAHEHPTLRDKVFKGSPWQDWRRALSYLDELGPAYVTGPGGKKRFGLGVEARSMAIPLAPWVKEASGERSGGVPFGVPGQRDDW